MISKKTEVFISMIIVIISTIMAFYVGNNVKHNGYNNLFLLPLLFGVMYVIFISPIRRRLNNIFIHIFIVVSFTRYIVLPYLIVSTGFYGGRSSVAPQNESFLKAINLMSYELIIVSFFVYIIFRKYKNNNSNNEIITILPKSNFLYVIFISTSLLLGLLFPQSLRSFGFLKVPTGLLDLGESSIIISIITYSLVVTKFLIFILAMSFIHKKYLKNKLPIYVFISLFLVLFSMSIFFGDNRSDFIITSIASVLLFYRLYPHTIKYTIVPLGVFSLIILSSLNDYRGNVTVTGGGNELLDLTGNLQVYLAGPYNVAIAIEAAELNEIEGNVLHLVHELLRPVMGLNIFLKEIDIKPSSSYFNERIFFNDHISQIMPMIGQGYFYLGFLLAPTITILYLLLVKFLIIVRDKEKRIEIIFFFGITIARMGFVTVQNGSILANDASFFLFLFLIIYYFNEKFVLRKKETSYKTHYKK